MYPPNATSPTAYEDDLQSNSDVYMESASGSGSSMPSNTTSNEMSESSRSGVFPSTLGPEDSASQRPPRSVTSEALSVESLHDEEGLFRTAYGRTFNAKCENYQLPVDGAEHNRHDVQHRILQLMLNSLYMPVTLVKNALAPSPNWEFPAIFDIGTGSGRWAFDMALEFPHCEVVGMDLVPPSLGGVGPIPVNLRFEVDDANLSLSHFANRFNVVHSRAIDPGISDFEAWLYNVAQTLRPHGVLLLCSGIPLLLNELLEPCQGEVEGGPRFSWLQRFWDACYTAYKNVGSTQVDAAVNWEEWLRLNPNYENVRSRDVYIPIGPWPIGMDERQTYVSELMRWNMTNISGSYRALLIADGHPPELAHRLIEASHDEMRRLTAHTYIRWKYTWAERRDLPWQVQLERPPAHPGLLVPSHASIF